MGTTGTNISRYGRVSRAFVHKNHLAHYSKLKEDRFKKAFGITPNDAAGQ